jgi:hypothetical protein
LRESFARFTNGIASQLVLSCNSGGDMATCFVIQPFDRGKFEKRYKQIFKPAIEAAGFQAYRVDEDPAVSIPINHIEEGIRKAAVCLADITLDNANVWFEVGYAYASNKDVVLVCERNSRPKFPFDIQHRNVSEYDTEAPEDFEILRSKIRERLEGVNNWISQQEGEKKANEEKERANEELKRKRALTEDPEFVAQVASWLKQKWLPVQQ